MGAEQLLGHGDMLFGPARRCRSVCGAFVSDQAIAWSAAACAAPSRTTCARSSKDRACRFGCLGEPGDPGVEVEGGVDGEQDPLYDQAVRIVIESRKASISGVQRLKIGYNRAARMIETMEATGIVGPLQSNGMREVLSPAPPEERSDERSAMRASRAR